METKLLRAPNLEVTVRNLIKKKAVMPKKIANIKKRRQRRRKKGFHKRRRKPRNQVKSINIIITTITIMVIASLNRKVNPKSLKKVRDTNTIKKIKQLLKTVVQK
jgi:hypothetical protein